MAQEDEPVSFLTVLLGTVRLTTSDDQIVNMILFQINND
jgi:hypothetical protein